MTKHIVILAGDGIGPEIMAEAEKVLAKVNDQFGLDLSWSHELLGGCAIDKHGVPLPDVTPFCSVPSAARSGTRSSVRSARSAVC